MQHSTTKCSCGQTAVLPLLITPTFVGFANCLHIQYCSIHRMTCLRILNHLKSNLPSLKGRRAPCMRMASTRGGAKAQKSSILHMLVTIRNLLSASYGNQSRCFCWDCTARYSLAVSVFASLSLWQLRVCCHCDRQSL